MTTDTTPKRKPHRAPAGLGAAGRALWRRLAVEYDFEVHELVVLEQACRIADQIADLEAVVDELGLTVPGSKGQPTLNRAVTELRQARLALNTTLGRIEFPASNGLTLSSQSTLARRAAHQRWSGATAAWTQ